MTVGKLRIRREQQCSSTVTWSPVQAEYAKQITDEW